MCQQLKPWHPLSPGQYQILWAARDFAAEQGRMPSEYETAAIVRMPRCGYVRRVVKKLRTRGDWKP